MKSLGESSLQGDCVTRCIETGVPKYTCPRVFFFREKSLTIVGAYNLISDDFFARVSRRS